MSGTCRHVGKRWKGGKRSVKRVKRELTGREENEKEDGNTAVGVVVSHD